jgi:hypothetical protein
MEVEEKILAQCRVEMQEKSVRNKTGDDRCRKRVKESSGRELKMHITVD